MTDKNREHPPRMYFIEKRYEKRYKGVFDGLVEVKRDEKGKPGVIEMIPSTEVEALLKNARAEGERDLRELFAFVNTRYGIKAHYCTEWDGLLIDKNMPEYDPCNCMRDKVRAEQERK